MFSIACITQALHALHDITCISLLHPDRLWALYAPYTPCQDVFLPPKDESLTQTSPATAHLVPSTPAAATNWLARYCAASNHVPEFTRPNPRSRGFLGHFCGSYSRYWCPAKARLDSWRAYYVIICNTCHESMHVILCNTCNSM